MEQVEVLVGREEVVKFKDEGTAIERSAVALAVVDEETRLQAADMRERARQFKAAVMARFKEPKEAADKAHKAVVALEKEMYGPAERVITILDRKASDYLMALERQRRAEEERLRNEAEAKAEAERKRLEKLAERQMEAGKFEKAEETIARAEDVQVMAPILPSIDRSVKTEAGGTSGSKDFGVAVDNVLLVIRQVADGKLPIACIEVNTSAIKAHAKLNTVNGKLPVIPGVRLIERFRFSGRAAAANNN